MKLNWVYGMRCTDVVKSFCYHAGDGGTGQEKILYFTACVVIVYYYKLNKQRHYIQHEKEVCSLAVSKGSLAASGERGSSPTIHVWDINTLQTVCILKSYHKHDIYL